ncbi:MAG: hypothetical protein E6J70_17070 [Deltaproteobacteria bacterium]|nr:MAG: hypothetical protein E6J70_17070 [Deltaproteobacteria bacterium]
MGRRGWDRPRRRRHADDGHARRDLPDERARRHRVGRRLLRVVARAPRLPPRLRGRGPATGSAHGGPRPDAARGAERRPGTPRPEREARRARPARDRDRARGPQPPRRHPLGGAGAFITAEIDRLGSVVSSLLEFARPLHLEPRAVSVRDLFDRAALLAEGELAAKGARLGRDESPGLPAVRADPDLLSQVLLGLLANAAEAVPPGGDVMLAARARDGAVELVVEDCGPGIPPELRDRVFEPFFTTRPRGVGLGLAVARQVVEAHGGRIEAGERPGGGARLTLRLPSAGQPAIAA